MGMVALRKLAVWTGAALLLCIAVLAVLREQGREGQPGTGRVAAPSPATAGPRIAVAVVDADGAPLSRASVTLLIGDDTLAAVTDPAGKAVIENAPRGEGTLLVQAARFARAERQLSVEQHEIRLRVCLLAGASLQGRVVDERGAGVSEARIEARRQDVHGGSVPPWTTVTDAQGNFRFDTLAEGAYALDASAELHERSVLKQIRAPAEKPLRIELARTASIWGKILRAPQGEPADKATVVTAGSGVWPPRRVLSGPDGSYRMDGLPGGFYEVGATLDQMVAERAEGLIIEPGSAVRLDLRLVEGQVLRGRVLDAESGAPLAKAEISAAEESLTFTSASTRSAEDGTFTITGLRDLEGRAHRVSVAMAGYVPIIGQQCRTGPTPHSFRLRRGATLSGQVVDEEGAPVTGAVIELGGTAKDGGPLLVGPPLPGLDTGRLVGTRMLGTLPFLPPDNLGVTRGAVPPIPIGPVAPLPGGSAAVQSVSSGMVTDQQGRFRLQGVPAGKLRLTARRTGFAPGSSAALTVASGAVLDDIVIELPGGGTLEGTVEDERGFPVAGVMVELRSANESFARTAISASDGSFAFDDVHGDAVLAAYPIALPPTHAEISVASGQTRQVKLVLQERAITLEGRVLDEAGFPIAGASVQVQALNTRSPVKVLARSASDGTFSVSGLPEPPYDLSVEHADYLPERIEKYAEYKSKAVVRLREGLKLSGMVVDAWDQKPLEDVLITVASRRPKVREKTRSDSQGRFGFRKLEPGDYSVSLKKRDYLSQRRRVAVRSDSKHRREVTMEAVALASGGSVSGEVVDRVGAPVPGALVALGDPPDWKKAIETDAGGRFTHTCVPSGDVALTARHPEAGKAAAPGKARVYQLEETPGIVIRLPGFAPQREQTRVPTDEGEPGEPEARPEMPGKPPARGFALQMDYRDGKVVVTDVAAGSAFERVGFRKDDVVITVDGESVLSAGQARGMMRVPGKDKVRVGVRRGKRTVTLRLSPEP